MQSSSCATTLASGLADSARLLTCCHALLALVSEVVLEFAINDNPHVSDKITLVAASEQMNAQVAGSDEPQAACQAGRTHALHTDTPHAARRHTAFLQEPFNSPSRRAFEQLIRRLLALPGRPAVML